MIEFSSSLRLNDVHIFDRPFNEDPKKYNFFEGGPNFEGGTVAKYRENGQ